MTNIKDNLNRVLDGIREAEYKAGRLEMSVSLLAVSKFHGADEVLQAAAAGQRVFGENRVKEAAAKFMEINKRLKDAKAEADGKQEKTAFDSHYAADGVSLHIIGTLQSNKIGKAVAIADEIESADSIEHLQEIEKQCSKIKKVMKVLFELHTGEESKSGFPNVDEMRRALALFAEGKMPHLLPMGFMTMAPFTDDEKVQRASFSALRNAKEMLSAEFPALPLTVLSMGMTGDYKAAIAEGSTEVRIGTAIFGERNYQK